jgi:hypothetical protein
MASGHPLPYAHVFETFRPTVRRDDLLRRFVALFDHVLRLEEPEVFKDSP